eukprot:Pompholyxophrys_punicea_v1_NODE_17_length_5980_cov_2.985654.p9 type:complete len:219 gc:universal NODE_17_length_5980_cov_2.985654:3308-3964(+)
MQGFSSFCSQTGVHSIPFSGITTVLFITTTSDDSAGLGCACETDCGGAVVTVTVDAGIVFVTVAGGCAADELVSLLTDGGADDPQSCDMTTFLLSSHDTSYFSLMDLKTIGGCCPLQGIVLPCLAWPGIPCCPPAACCVCAACCALKSDAELTSATELEASAAEPESAPELRPELVFGEELVPAFCVVPEVPLWAAPDDALAATLDDPVVDDPASWFM